MFPCRREAHQPLAHICCMDTVAALIPLPLIHLQPSTALVPSQKKGFVRHSAGHQITGTTCTERLCLALLSSRSRLMGEKGVKRSSRSGSCTPVSSPSYTCGGAWKKNCAGKRERCCATASPVIQGDVPRDPRGCGCGSGAVCLIMHTLTSACRTLQCLPSQQLYIKHNPCNFFPLFLRE